jgi:hypothetical protein
LPIYSIGEMIMLVYLILGVTLVSVAWLLKKYEKKAKNNP